MRIVWECILLVMNIEIIRDYCLNKPAVTESFPFDEDTLVFKIGNTKMFLLASLERVPLRINLKALPEKAVEWREKYPQITPGYHMNKKHWNSVVIDGLLPDSLIFEMIDESYHLVVKSLSKKLRNELGITV